MRPIEKKIRDRIKSLKAYTVINPESQPEQFTTLYKLNESAILEWVLSELQKENNLIQEMLDMLENLNKNIKYQKLENLIQKVKQEMSIDKAKLDK